MDLERLCRTYSGFEDPAVTIETFDVLLDVNYDDEAALQLLKELSTNSAAPVLTLISSGQATLTERSVDLTYLDKLRQLADSLKKVKVTLEMKFPTRQQELMRVSRSLKPNTLGVAESKSGDGFGC